MSLIAPYNMILRDINIPKNDMEVLTFSHLGMNIVIKVYNIN